MNNIETEAACVNSNHDVKINDDSMECNNRHAYLVMAHHKFDILCELLKAIDDERNDIFLHVDLKARDVPVAKIRESVRNAKLIFTDRMDVHWGGFSQIECIMMLLKTATATGYHSYYHFMVGVEFPLRSQKYIHDFFKCNQGFEFIGFDRFDQRYIERVRYYHVFNEYARNNNLYQKALNKIRILCVFLQRMAGVNLIKQYKLKFKKGNANWSITHQLAKAIIEEEDFIKKVYRHSFCGDEVFIHTIIYNSKFWNNVYDKDDEYHSAMRITTWSNPYNQYHLDDADMLMTSGRLFARKIDGDDAIDLINLIRKRWEIYG